jgi:abortive infection bacteriophage resistance protein
LTVFVVHFEQKDKIMKHAMTVEQQIEMLKTRGMIIEDEKKTKEILGDIGYFRLGFYCFPFETNYKKRRSHQYRQGTRFSDVVNLYYLDTDLRRLLSNALNRIEINFRTNIIYTASNQYVNCNTWFIDPVVMEKTFVDKFDTELYNENFRKNSIIKNHHRKYINDKLHPRGKLWNFLLFAQW